MKKTGLESSRKRAGTDELDRSRRYPIHVDIIDVGTEYKISVSNGPSGAIMAGQSRTVQLCNHKWTAPAYCRLAGNQLCGARIAARLYLLHRCFGTKPQVSKLQAWHARPV